MRFAISVVVGTLALCLLTVGIYGDPGSFFHNARGLWIELLDVPPTEAKDDLGSDQVGRMQQQIAQLQHELAAKEAGLAKPADVAPVKSVAALETVADLPPEPQQHEAPEVPSIRSEPVQTEVAAAQAPQPHRPEAEVFQFATPRGEPPREPLLKSELLKPDVPHAASPRQDLAKAEPAKPEAARPAPQKLALVRPPPPPPPLPIRQETDDTQSVLARLRQGTSGPVRTSDPQQSIEPKARPVPSPSIPRLTAARAALAAGRVEDARRMLQEAQLQLVFRPENMPGDDQPSAA